jgi:hypothetical protein
MLLSLAEAAVSDEQPTKPECEGSPAKPDGWELASISPVTLPQSAQPSLEEWIARYGGRARIPWAEWDRAVEAWKAERRAEFERKKLLGRMQSAATRNRHSRNGAATSLERSTIAADDELIGVMSQRTQRTALP